MQVIGAGLGRTGTMSLQAALERLGVGPCYHMIELYKHPRHSQLWLDVAEGRPVPWESIFQGYGATVDFPACLFYEALMAQYPEAKVLLSVREGERWYESTRATIAQMPTTFPRWLRWLVPPLDRLLRMADRLIWQGFFEGRFQERAATLDRFARWNAEVQARVPPERLLVYEVTQGWEPLCAFLGVPVPDAPFPHLNDKAELQRMIRRVRALGVALPAAAGVLGVALLAHAWRQRTP